MEKLTITEALAELKTIDKRIDNKNTFVKNYLARQDMVKDPLEKDGGSVNAIKAEIQSINDLLTRKIAIRGAIQAANQQTKVAIKGKEMSISDWIVWKREVFPLLKNFYNGLSNGIAGLRRDAMNKGVKITDGQAPAQPTDIVVNVNEQWLKVTIEELSEIEGTLDGLLSLKNATVVVEF
jgi:hypothetical protein